MKTMCYYINLPYACCGVSTDVYGYVIDTAPIVKWMKGKHIDEVRGWVQRKGGTCDPVNIHVEEVHPKPLPE